MVGMMAIAIIAQSAAQMPTRSKTRDKLRHEMTIRTNEWFARCARLDIAGRYRKGLKKARA
jgi:hypothetical protein